MTQLQIRHATFHDTPAIAAVLKQVFMEYQGVLTPAALVATTPTPDQIAQRLVDGPIWVAVLNQQIVGTVSAIPKTEGVYIRSMAILPAARGQGIGRLLLAQIENFAHIIQYPRLFLSTASFLNRAVALYEKAGFERSDDGPTELYGTPIFSMAKSLN